MTAVRVGDYELEQIAIIVPATGRAELRYRIRRIAAGVAYYVGRVRTEAEITDAIRAYEAAGIITET